MLKKINKGITVEQIISAVRLAKDSPIFFSYSFIVDLPDETREDFRMTFDLINKLLSIKKNGFVSAIHRYFAYPGTPLSLEAEKRSGIDFESQMTFEKFADLSLAEYNMLTNPHKVDMYKECVLEYFMRKMSPPKKEFSLRGIISALIAITGWLRKKINFYHLPVEIYVIKWLRSKLYG